MTEEEFLVHYRECESRLRAFIWNSFGRDVDDIASTAWMYAWKAREQFEKRKDCQFFTWLCRIAINVIRAQLRNERRSKRIGGTVPLTPVIIGTAKAPDSAHSIWARVQVADILKADKSGIIQMRFVMGLEFGEIARYTKMNVNTVKTQVRRFQEKL